MNRLFYIFLFLLFGIIPLFSQKMISFTNPTNGLYGIKNEANDTLIQAQYLEIIEIFNDSLFVVKSKHEQIGIVNKKNEIHTKFGNECLSFYTLEQKNYGKVYECSTPKQYTSNVIFFVDKTRSCIPTEYYPCPYWKKLTKDSLSKSLQLVQTAKDMVFAGDIDSAKRCSQLAIQLKPNNAYYYYARAELLYFNDSAGNIRPKKELEALNDNEIDSICYYLNKADSLETNDLFNQIIKTKKYEYYNYTKPNKTAVKKLEKELNNNYTFVDKTGFFLIAGLSGYEDTEIEIGVGLGSITKRNSFKQFDIKNPDGSIFLGLTWTKNVNYNIEAFKLFLFTNIKPLSLGIYPILYTNYYQNCFMIRPEIGYGYGIFSINAGYNLFVTGTKFPEINGFNLNVKAYIPISTTINLVNR